MYKTRRQESFEFGQRVSFKMFLIAVAGLGLAAAAFSLGLIGPPKKVEPTFEQAAAAAQAKADARNAQAAAVRQEAAR